jgi:nicotinate-nucleotide--dimethylbenzimidazole phosphoribosyltransferase
MHRLAPAPLASCVGLGAGHDAAGMARKMAALELAAARSDAVQPFEVLRQFGGYEIAAMAGAALGAAAMRRAVIVDGFIATAAVLTAVRMAPVLADYCVFAHMSSEQGHRLMLASLSARSSSPAPSTRMAWRTPPTGWAAGRRRQGAWRS